MLLEGLILSVAGMGTVFLFLMLLVWVMGVTAKAVRMLEEKGLVAPAGAPAGAFGAKAAASAPAGTDMARVAAAIAVAGRQLGKY